MKRIISSLVLVALTFAAFSQRRPVIRPQDESKKKTEFKHAIFRANYLVQNRLIQFLEESNEMITFDSEYLKVNAKDLYYENSMDYNDDDAISFWIKDKYLVSDERKIKLLDATLNISRKWKIAIIEQDVLEEMLKPINGKYTFSVKNNTIYAASPPSKNGSNQNIYKFEFDKNHRILSQNLGGIEYKDSLYWTTSNYEYKGKHLYKDVFKKCNDIRCVRGYELEIKIYNKRQVIKNTKQTYSRKDNEFIKEEITDYFYSKRTLDSTVTKSFNIINESPQLSKTRICKYKKGKISTIKEVWLKRQSFRNQKYFIENKYDKKGRLIASEYKGWDNNDDVAEIRIEEFEYHENKYVYRYKQNLKKKNGKEKLPLQYELTYVFY